MNMIDEEDCDDLPPITVNSSANNSSTFAMPTAEELAEQRAREMECEHQLELLRQRAQADESVARLRHSDSSGSEGELALAAAVTALSVRVAPPRTPAAPPAAALWAALAPRLPPPGAALSGAPLSRAVRALGAALRRRAAWPEHDVLCAAALLCVAALAHDSRCRRAAARVLHALLDEHAAPALEAALVRVLLASFPAARVRLQLADALRSGGDAAADRAAFALTAAAMLDLLRPPDEDGEARDAADAGEPVSLERVAHASQAWRACSADTRYTCVQLAGRLLAATDAAGAADASSATRQARARLLAHLAPPPAAASDAQRPDRLKALVGASKLKLLFSAKNGVSRQPQPQQDTAA